ncbi:hypothetical protein ACCAA_890024 [Candidatus Accumulibacter aalborgensis]|uniref:Uncharacterized protein n=1 Tax=Candidatus Accumulibacter aalborgensis TaxID=1860102 RepID=A0A1A8XYW8_9PROT|nr:hypothetical protein ACCAA_890024 [Candidatus Accumulibacter aalborgensis]
MRRDGDLVHYLAISQILERPRQMLRVDALHRRAHADRRRHELDDLAFVPEFFGQAVHQIEFGADQPAGVRAGFLDRSDDVFGRADKIRLLAHFEAAFRVGDDQAVRILVAEAQDVRRLKHLVHRAVAFPEQEFRAPDLLGSEATHFEVGVPDHHFVEWNSHPIAGPAAEMLVGKEENLFPALEGPASDRSGVRRGAHDAAACTAEGLEIGGRVDVGHRGDLLIDVEYLAEFAPAALDLGQIGHVGHRAAGGEVRQDGHLFRLRHDVGDFGHEMHAAEDNVLRFGLRGEAREFQRVTGKVGVLVNVGTLVVVAEQNGLVAKPLAGSADALMARIVLQLVEVVEADGRGLHGRVLEARSKEPGPACGKRFRQEVQLCHGRPA